MTTELKNKLKTFQLYNGIFPSGNLDDMTKSYLKNMAMIAKVPISSSENFSDDEINRILKKAETRISNQELSNVRKAVKEKEKETATPEVDTAQDLFELDTDGMNSPECCFVDGVTKDFLKEGEYVNESYPNKRYIFLHHTAGWPNPRKQKKIWENDDRGRIGTHYIIGGQSINPFGGDYSHEVIQAIPLENWAYHLGRNVDYMMHRESIGMEFCNFGWVNNGRVWTGNEIHEDRIATLKRPFRGYGQWHKYSDEQLKHGKKLIIALSNKYSIDIRNQGLIKWLKEGDHFKAFEFKDEARRGDVEGLLSHTNVQRGKFDVSPQDNLIDMLLSI